MNTLTEVQRAAFVRQLTIISEEAERIASVKYSNASAARQDTARFCQLIEGLEAHISVISDKKILEFREMTVHELVRIQKLSTDPNILDIDKPLSEEIFTTVMSLAGSLKYYLSLAEQESQRPGSVTSSTNLNDSTGSGLSRPRSQLTMGIVSFARSCTRTIDCLKDRPVLRSNLIPNISEMLSVVRELLEEEMFAPNIEKSTMANFINAVKTLRSITKDDLTHDPIIQILFNTVQPMAAAMKQASMDSHSDSRGSGTIFSGGSEPKPLAQKPFLGSKSSEKISDHVDSLETVYNNSLSRLPPDRSSVSQSSLTPSIGSQDSLSLSRPGLELFDRTSSSMSRQRNSFASFERFFESDWYKLRVTTITPTKIDYREVDHAFDVSLEICGTRLDSKKSFKKVVKVQEEFILRLWGDIDAKYPQYLTKMSFDHVKSISNRKMRNNVALSEFSIFFQAITAREVMREDRLTLEFVSDALCTEPPQYSPLRKDSSINSMQHSISSSQLDAQEPRRLVSDPSKKSPVPAASGGSPTKLFGPKTSWKEGFRSLSFDNLALVAKSSDSKAPRKSSETGERSPKGSSKFRMSKNSESDKKPPKHDPVRKAQNLLRKSRGSSPSRIAFIQFSDSAILKGFEIRDFETLVKRDLNGADELVVKCVEGKPRIMAVKKEQLVSKVLEYHSDIDLFNCFVVTFRSFMKPHELLIKLIEIYKENASSSGGPVEAGQMQIAAFLDKWIESSWYDFDKDVNLQNGLEKFIKIITASKKIALMASQIEKTVEKQRRILHEEQTLANMIEKKLYITNVGKADFVSWEPSDIALQMTKIDNEIFLRIRSAAYVEYLYEKENNKSILDTWVDRFNTVSFWVGTEICTTPLLKQRIIVLQNMIRIAKYLKEYHNYNALMAVISGLNSSSVRRLHKTWAGLPSRYSAYMDELEKIMSPQMNYSAYREIENRYRSLQSFIPFLGLYLKDFTFANDGNKKMRENGLVNFEKNWIIYDLVCNINSFRTPDYTFAVNEAAYDYCKQIVALPEKRLYSYSLLCEPRVNKEQSKSTSSYDLANVRLIEKWSK